MDETKGFKYTIEDLARACESVSSSGFRPQNLQVWMKRGIDAGVSGGDMDATQDMEGNGSSQTRRHVQDHS